MINESLKCQGCSSMYMGMAKDLDAPGLSMTVDTYMYPQLISQLRHVSGFSGYTNIFFSEDNVRKLTIHTNTHLEHVEAQYN